MRDISDKEIEQAWSQAYKNKERIMGSKFRITYINDLGHIRQQDIAAGSIDEALELFRRKIDHFVMMIFILDTNE